MDGVGCGWLGLESMGGFVEVPLGRGDTKTIGKSRSRVFFEFVLLTPRFFLGLVRVFFEFFFFGIPFYKQCVLL